ncbi:galactose-3-O-sulfotransferase 2 [Lingula anatina]|uniref:Galactose-3-O-sulfotransferase 2 n=1 Tax=Lingula anatina TaxID=7574 RepID=A0A1S3H7P7_LINAN|nr:galactose-3-O-sulfotransferase 2 [Lingula anatina]|eukprot:XP_013382140.1 galactose-3-O-sulfotransferase 2 [Lingula anatina]
MAGKSYRPILDGHHQLFILIITLAMVLLTVIYVITTTSRKTLSPPAAYMYHRTWGKTAVKTSAILTSGLPSNRINITVANISSFRKREQNRLLEMARRNHCKPRTHVVVRKVHKCGSTTVSNIFVRFAFLNNLTVAGKRDVFGPSLDKPKFDMILHHVKYSDSHFLAVMHEDTYFIGLLREPISQFRSAFSYYKKRTDPVLTYKTGNHMLEYVQDYPKFINEWKRKVGSSMLPGLRRNNMAQFLGGFRESDSDNEREIIKYIDFLDRRYDFVILIEHLDECLVFLKRALCWDLKDILYTNRMVYRPIDPTETNDKQLEKLLSNFTNVNRRLYSHFSDRLSKIINDQGVDFQEEVQYFKRINPKVTNYCNKSLQYNLPPLVVKQSKWSNGFSVDYLFCWFLNFAIAQTKLLFPGWETQ